MIDKKYNIFKIIKIVNAKINIIAYKYFLHTFLFC